MIPLQDIKFLNPDQNQPEKDKKIVATVRAKAMSVMLENL